MVLDHLQIGGAVVELAFGILFGGIVLTLALAVGLGSRDIVSRSLERSADRSGLDHPIPGDPDYKTPTPRRKPAPLLDRVNFISIKIRGVLISLAQVVHLQVRKPKSVHWNAAARTHHERQIRAACRPLPTQQNIVAIFLPSPPPLA